MTRLSQAYKGGYDGKPGYWLHFHYDEELIERLKQIVPASERTWDEDNKRWWVSEDACERVLAILPQLETFMKQPELGLEI